MMDLPGIEGIIGIFLVGLALFDLLVTAASLHRAGPLSSRAARGIGGGRRLLPVAAGRWSGSLALATVVLVWVTPLWSAWSLLFHDLAGRISAPDGSPIGWLAAVAFAGSSFSTLGLGADTLQTISVHILASVAPVLGMMLLSPSASFVLNVSQSAVSARSVAIRLHELSRRIESLPPECATEFFLSRISDLSSNLHSLIEKRRTFPLACQYDLQTGPCAIGKNARHLTEAITQLTQPPTFADERLEITLLCEALIRLADDCLKRDGGSNMATLWSRSRISGFERQTRRARQVAKENDGMLKIMITDHQYIHVFIGILGNTLFLTGSVMFFDRFASFHTRAV